MAEMTKNEILHGQNVHLVILALLICLCGVLFYTFILYPLYVTPLSKFPNAHWLAPFTLLWIFWTRWKGCEIDAIIQSHQKLGPVVRLGPKEVSVNHVDSALLTIHHKGFEKPPWYSFFSNYGFGHTVPPLQWLRLAYDLKDPQYHVLSEYKGTHCPSS